MAQVIANRRDSRESDCSNSKIIWAAILSILWPGAHISSNQSAIEPTFHPIRV